MNDVKKYINGSLLVTPELCETYRGCGQGLKFMKELYPQGFTVDEVYTGKVRHIPMHFVCWGYHFLPFTDDDKGKFLEYAKIKFSQKWYDSHHIFNCSEISHSSYCEDSTDVASSTNIRESLRVRGSSNVYGSTAIYESDDIKNSFCCVNSDFIEKSSYIYSSNSCKESYGLYQCEKIERGYLLNKVEECKYVIASNVSGVNNRIFCTEECPDAEYAIFNKEVSRNTFDYIFNRLVDAIAAEGFIDAESQKFSYLWARANLVKAISPVIQEIFPRISEEEKLLLFENTLYVDALKI